MDIANISEYIAATEQLAAVKARQGVRSLERYIVGGWHEDLCAYYDFQAEAVTYLWRLARIRDLLRPLPLQGANEIPAGADPLGYYPASPCPPIPEDIAAKVTDIQAALPQWSDKALERAQTQLVSQVLPPEIEIPPGKWVSQVVLIDAEIDLCMLQIQACKTLPPERRVLATNRLHTMLRLLEEARHAAMGAQGETG